MPVSKKTEEEQANRSSEGAEPKPKKKRKPHNSTHARNRKQKVKARYSKAREEAQLAGIIPTTPEGAVRNERVEASAQSDQPLPNLTSQAIRKGWAVPEERKPQLVDELLDIVSGIEVPAKVKVAAYNALRQGDQAQYERDNPQTTKPKGVTINGDVNVNNSQTNIEANQSVAEQIRGMVLSGQLGKLEGVRTLTVPCASSDEAHIREMEGGSSSPRDQ